MGNKEFKAIGMRIECKKCKKQYTLIPNQKRFSCVECGNTIYIRIERYNLLKYFENILGESD